MTQTAAAPEQQVAQRESQFPGRGITVGTGLTAPKIPLIILKPTNDLVKAVACILEGAARFIRKCGVAKHNR